MQIHRPLLVPFFAGLLTVATGVAQAGQPTENLNACAAVGDNSERLHCYDEAVNRKLPDTPVDTAATAAPESSAPGKIPVQAEMSPNQLFGLGADAIRRSYGEALGEDVLQELRASVTEIRSGGIDRILVVLDNGQIWRQVDTTNLKIKVGDAVVIQTAALGSFKLKKDGSNRSMRVNRAK